MFYLICAWINAWVNNREAGDLRRYFAYYDVIVMILEKVLSQWLYLPVEFNLLIHLREQDFYVVEKVFKPKQVSR